MEEGHARLQQIGKHGIVEVTTRVHADLHENKAAQQCGNRASDDAECVYVYGIQRTEETVRVQRENRPKEAVVVHVRELCVASVSNTPDILQGGPV